MLTALLQRIMRQEGRHLDFYATQAVQRLAGSPRARRITRFALQCFWRPVGSGVVPREEMQFLTLYLFGGADDTDIPRRIDRRVDRFPGLGDLRLVERAVARLAA